MKKTATILSILFFCLFRAGIVFAYQLDLAYLHSGDVEISNPENSQTFFDSLQGTPRDYYIDSPKEFNLYLNILVPDPANRDGKFSVNVFFVNGPKTGQVALIDGTNFDWQEIYDPVAREYYMKGPELERQFGSGKYKIEVSSKGDAGKYILAVGKNQSYQIMPILDVFWQLPLLKATFLKTDVLQFFLTPFGIAGIGAVGFLLILIAVIYFLIGIIKQIVKHNLAKTLLLTSAGMEMKNEIKKLLIKPAYDVTVAFISTAAKPQENLDYLKKDWNIMRDELGFNLEEVDIDGKNESQVMELLKLKDIIFVEGGNAFYLLNAMRKCNFEKIIRKLLKEGKVYIGVSAGSIVAGKTIQSAGWMGDENFVKLKNLKGLNLVPFDVFCHYNPQFDGTIKQKIKNPKKRAKKLRILTDSQAILVQAGEIDLIGQGEKIIV